jgi:hypothetical protein
MRYRRNVANFAEVFYSGNFSRNRVNYDQCCGTVTIFYGSGSGSDF